MEKQLASIADTIDNVAKKTAVALGTVRGLTKSIAVFTAPAAHPRVAEFNAKALEVCRRLLPQLKEFRRVIDEQIAVLEGTWQPPAN